MAREENFGLQVDTHYTETKFESILRANANPDEPTSQIKLAKRSVARMERIVLSLAPNSLIAYQEKRTIEYGGKECPLIDGEIYLDQASINESEKH